MAVSTKKGSYLGEKGLGFKSVFAASNQPTLISHAWKFAFCVPGQDEMSYIAPVWIQDEAIPEQVRHYIEKDPFDTHLYLPLKLQPYTQEADQFLEQVAGSIDACLLLNLSQLQQLQVIDQRKNQMSIVKKAVLENTYDHWESSAQFEGYTFTNLTKKLIQLTTGSTKNNFRVYSTDIVVPSVIEHRRKTSTTRLILAFPCDKEYVLTYNVYAGLPVCHLGFKFLVNGDFQLVTSRESVRQDVPFNEFLRNHLSVLFVYLLLNDSNLKKDLDQYCPSTTTEQIKHFPWWLVMVDRINELITKYFATLFNINSGKSIRRFNVDLASLASNEQLDECADICVISPTDNGLFTEERLKTFEVEPVSIIDVVNCFPNRDNRTNQLARQQFQLRAQQQNEEWWEKLFRYVAESMTDKLANLLVEKAIFLYQSSDKRRYLPVNTGTSRFLLFTTDDSSLHMWKEQLILLQYASQSERNALLKSYRVQLLTEERLIKIILFDHLQIATCSSAHRSSEIELEEIWQDLVYLQSHIDKVNKSDRFLVPVKDSSLYFAAIQDVTLPTILGVNIEDVLTLSNSPVIQFPYYRKRVDDDTLEWEHFFLQMNCQKPVISLPNAYKITQLPLLRPFNLFTNAKLAEEIFSTQLVNTQECLRQFPVCAHVNGDEQICSVANTFDERIIDDLIFLPHVSIPSCCRALAKLLGVLSEYDLRACVTVLQFLSKQKNINEKLYVEWLSRLQFYVHQQLPQFQLTDILSLCQIYLPDHKQFRPLKDLLVVEDKGKYNGVITLVSEYLNLPIISPSINQIYWQFKDLFRALSCTCAVSLAHLFKTIHLASSDTNNFYTIGDCKTILREDRIETMINLYQYLEQLILDCVETNKSNHLLFDAIVQRTHPKAPCASQEDWQWRFSLTSKNIFNELKILIGLDEKHETLPLLTIDRQFCFISSNNIVYACMEQKIIEHLTKTVGKRYFILPLITQTCPLVLAACAVNYVEQNGTVRWIRNNRNLEYSLDNVTDIFRDTLQDSQLEVIASKYVNLELLISDPWQAECVKHYSANIDYRFLIFAKTILLCIDMKSTDVRVPVIAASALATLLHKRQSIPFEDAKLIARQKIETCRSFYSKKRASSASSGPKNYSYIDILFPTNQDSIEWNPILIGKQSDVEHEDTSVDQELMVSITRNAQHRLYRQRVKQMTDRCLEREKFTRTQLDSYIVDYFELVRIGQNAEHFFFCYLQHLYGTADVTPTRNWRSSSRLIVYPNYLRGVNDSVGYDFQLDDRKEIFVPGRGPQTKRCYFEVKGIGGSFDEETTRFHITNSELTMCEDIARDEQRRENEAYLIVIVQYCLNTEKISLATIIDWCDHARLTTKSLT